MDSKQKPTFSLNLDFSLKLLSLLLIDLPHHYSNFSIDDHKRVLSLHFHLPKSHFGYKNHINIDKEHKLIRRYAVTDASVHDSQVFDEALDEESCGYSVWVD